MPQGCTRSNGIENLLGGWNLRANAAIFRPLVEGPLKAEIPRVWPDGAIQRRTKAGLSASPYHTLKFDVWHPDQSPRDQLQIYDI